MKSLRSSVLGVGFSALAALLAFAITLLIVVATGGPGLEAAQALFDGAFGGTAQIAGTLSKMVPLTLTALGWIVAFSARRINIGLEGQMLAGGTAAAVLALLLPPLPGFILLPLCVLTGCVGGAAYAGIAAWLWAVRSVNDFISTLLLNFVIALFVNWLIRGPLEEPTHSLAQSSPVPVAARWPSLIPLTSLHYDVILIPLAAIAIAFLLTRTVFGLRLRLTGVNAVSARAAGIHTVSTSVLAMLISGGLAGLAGSSVILGGSTANIADNFSSNYGFDGIVVALLARNSPLATLPAALLMAALRQGGGLMEARVGISAAVVLIMQGLVIALVAGGGILVDRRSRRRVDVRAVPVVAKEATHGSP